MLIFTFSMVLVFVVIAVREFPGYGYFGREWQALKAWIKGPAREYHGAVKSTVRVTPAGWDVRHHS